MLVHTLVHSWLKQLSISYIPGPSNGLADWVASGLIRYFQGEGHRTPASQSLE